MNGSLAVMILQILLMIIFPYFVIFLTQKSKILNWMSPVVLCYIAGLLLANQQVIPINKEISVQISEISIPLAICLILFSTNLISWFKTTRKVALSFLLCVIAGTISSVVAAYLFASHTEEAWKLAGMTIGVYTGGTPNMSAIGLSLGVNEETFVLLNAADFFLGGIYLMFLMTLAHPLLKKIYPAYISKSNEKENRIDPIQDFHQHSVLSKIKYALAAIGLAVFILAVSIGLSFLISGKLSVVVIIVSVTSLAISSSLIKFINSLPGTYVVGEYMLLIFCLAIGSMAEFSMLLESSTAILYFVSVAMFGAIVIHFLLAKLFKIDADTVLITSVAGIYGPAFVPPIASVMKNKEIILSGIATGILGYAIANYWGLLVAYFLQP